MTFDELVAVFKPGMVARRPTWDRYYTLQMHEDGVLRLIDTREPHWEPEYKNVGYTAKADDYYFV